VFDGGRQSSDGCVMLLAQNYLKPPQSAVLDIDDTIDVIALELQPSGL
jgi:hypothetical protein